MRNRRLRNETRRLRERQPKTAARINARKRLARARRAITRQQKIRVVGVHDLRNKERLIDARDEITNLANENPPAELIAMFDNADKDFDLHAYVKEKVNNAVVFEVAVFGKQTNATRSEKWYGAKLRCMVKQILLDKPELLRADAQFNLNELFHEASVTLIQVSQLI